MPPERIHVGARIPKELYNKCVQDYGNITDAINAGLELLFKQSENKTENGCKTIENECKTTENSNEQWIREQIKDSQQEVRIKDLQEQNKVKDQLQEARIADLKDQIQALNEQINKKDSQIEDSNKNVFAQANSLYNLTRESKLLSIEKKSFWQSLKFW